MSVIFVLLSLVSILNHTIGDNLNASDVSVSGETKVLLRRKRFIIFPEGSSFQVVFCVTYPTIFSIGDIFLWGNTAALAFELPQDPYSPFDHRADPLHRRVDSKTIYFTDYDGKVIGKTPYKKKPIVNPAFAKRSLDFENERGKFEIDRKQMHALKHKRDFLKSEHADGNVEFQRSGRLGLYGKIETMLQGLGGNGKQCLLKTLCLVGQTRDQPQGEFLQEILRAVFTLPKNNIEEEFYKEYDEAQHTTGSCDDLYPDCDSPLADPSSPTLSY